MILPQFIYKKAKSIDEALNIFQKYNQNALYLAGGTDLIPQLKLRLHKPKALIDLKGIKDLNVIQLKENHLYIGANTTLFELKKNSVVRDNFPALYHSLDATSCETLQMRGTIGGNILQNTRCLFYNKSQDWRNAKGFCYKMGGETCNVVQNARSCFANYCSDNVPALLTLSAKVALKGIDGDRELDLIEIFNGGNKKPFRILPGEMLTAILIPLKKTNGAYEKLRVRDSIDYPLVNAAFSIEEGKGKLSVGAVGPVPHVYHLDDIGQTSVESILKSVYSDSKPVANSTLSVAYRKKMTAVLAKRVIAKVVQGVK